MQFGAVSDVGMQRKINEDSFFTCDDELFPYIMVADGMGGHQAGEVASMMAVDIVYNYLKNNLNEQLDFVEAGEVVRQAFISANNIVYNYAKNHYRIMGMGTTATLALVYRNKLICAHIGDSRAYTIGDGIKQITRDHSYVQELVSCGKLTKEEAKHHPKKNYITRAIGAEETVKVDIVIKPYNGETVLLCSDGLTNFVEDDELFEYISDNNDLQTGAQKLIALANERGGMDNITAVLLKKEESSNE